MMSCCSRTYGLTVAAVWLLSVFVADNYHRAEARNLRVKTTTTTTTTEDMSFLVNDDENDSGHHVDEDSFEKLELLSHNDTYKIPGVDSISRQLSRPRWEAPSWFISYRKEFGAISWKSCSFLQWSEYESDPNEGDACFRYSSRYETYQCGVGTQTCSSSQYGETHPTKICTCDNEKQEFTDCQVWQPCEPLPAKWSRVYSMPLVAVAAFPLYDGRVLVWSAFEKTGFGGDYGKTWTAIFNPETGLSEEELIVDTNHDMFCPGTATLEDGRLMITGGSSIRQTTYYDPFTDSWSRGALMNQGRGYHSMTTLEDGSVLALGGSWSGGRGRKMAEVWNPNTLTWRRLRGINPDNTPTLLTKDNEGVYRSDNHMWLFPSKDGKVFHAGPSIAMHWMDMSGDGSIRESPLKRGNVDTMCGNAVMYDIGKILTLGGSPNYTSGEATKAAHVIDISEGEGKETIRQVGDMFYKRVMVGSAVLPNGEVVVIGGQEEPIIFTDLRAVFHAEIWNPVTERFSLLPEMVKPRVYHSIVTLLKNGKVMAAGGGLCGHIRCSANHLDAEILTPPYLLNADGTEAVRPEITSAPDRIGSSVVRIYVETKDSEDHSFALIRVGAVTHSTNNDNRRVPLEVEARTGRRHTISVPTNRNILLPGSHYLFAMNGNGVPSEGHVVLVSTSGGQPITISTTIRSQTHSGLCVALDSQSSKLVQLTCDGGPDQQFSFEPVGSHYRVRIASTGLCVQSYSPNVSFLSVEQGPCDDNDHQLWSVEGAGTMQQMRAKHSGHCLAINQASLLPGAEIKQWPCNPRVANDKWQIDDRLQRVA